jgi:hypothetical protein
VTAGVIDASIAMTWCFEDEASRDTDRLSSGSATTVRALPCASLPLVGRVFAQL